MQFLYKSILRFFLQDPEFGIIQTRLYPNFNSKNYTILIYIFEFFF